MKDQLAAIISNPLSTESQKSAAQAMLDSLTASAPVAEPNSEPTKDKAVDYTGWPLADLMCSKDEGAFKEFERRYDLWFAKLLERAKPFEKELIDKYYSGTSYSKELPGPSLHAVVSGACCTTFERAVCALEANAVKDEAQRLEAQRKVLATYPYDDFAAYFPESVRVGYPQPAPVLRGFSVVR